MPACVSFAFATLFGVELGGNLRGKDHDFNTLPLGVTRRARRYLALSNEMPPLVRLSPWRVDPLALLLFFCLVIFLLLLPLLGEASDLPLLLLSGEASDLLLLLLLGEAAFLLLLTV